MEKDFVSWFRHQYPDLQFAHSNFSSRGLDIGQQNSAPMYMPLYANEFPVKGVSPFSFSGLLESKPSQPSEPHNWFLSTVVKEKLAPPQSVDDVGGNKEANAGRGSVQKRFLVFDQSGDQTTLLYSSPNVTPVQCLPSWHPKAPAPCNLIKEGGQILADGVCPSGNYYFGGEYYEANHRDDVESELHEDTEELNALLYSDDDSHSEDGEETSTGHSPSTMTAPDDLPPCLDEMVEVASSEWPSKRRKRLDGGFDIPSLVDTASSANPFWPSKRRKRLDGGFDIPSLVDTASSAKPFTCSDLEDDAESSCGNSHNQVSELVSLSGKKRPRKDQILETISILQKIIPGGKGKDSMDVIDEAICYLRSLKVKAKSLGLDTL